MSEVLLDMAMSLDGFSVDRMGHSLYPTHQLKGTPTLYDMIETTGAIVMDQETYDLADNDFSSFAYQVPIFIVTDRQPDTIAKGENQHLKFKFVTDGIAHAVKLARLAAKTKTVTISGEAKLAQMALEAGVVDFLKIRLINVIAGKGVRLFEHLSDQLMKLETVSINEFGSRTDLYYKITRYKYFSDEITSEDVLPHTLHS